MTCITLYWFHCHFETINCILLITFLEEIDSDCNSMLLCVVLIQVNLRVSISQTYQLSGCNI